jgi:protoporphyrinogen/coproporphyrinogen III oxidase
MSRMRNSEGVTPPTDPRAQRPRVVVVGAGISGLAAARELRAQRPDVEVVVLEAGDRVGGKLRLAEVGGTTVDVGAESILFRRPEGVELARAAGLGEDVVHPATTAARVWSRGRLVPLPRSLLGVPADLDDLRASGLLSGAGLARAAQEPEQPATPLDGDLSVGALVEQRFGAEVVDRLVEPLLGGVYAGHAREISARAAAPQVVALLDRDTSMLRAAAAATAASSGAPVFAGLAGGVARLAEAVAAPLDVRLGTTVRELRRGGSRRWLLVTGPVVAPTVLEADAVVLATPAPATARLLHEVAPAAARELATVEYASMAVVTLAYRAPDFPVVEGSGFLVPPVDRRAVKAATWSTNKWDWVRRSTPDLVLLRTSLGRHREEADLQVPDEELVARSVRDLADATGVRAGPVDSHVQRWGGALPQYAVGHLDRVRRTRDAVAAVPGLAVCGAAYDGLGIPACIATGRAAAAQVLRQLEQLDPLSRDGRMTS